MKGIRVEIGHYELTTRNREWKAIQFKDVTIFRSHIWMDGSRLRPIIHATSRSYSEDYEALGPKDSENTFQGLAMNRGRWVDGYDGFHTVDGTRG